MAPGNFDTLTVTGKAEVGELTVGNLIDLCTRGQDVSRFGMLQVEPIRIPNPKDPQHPNKLYLPLVLQPDGGNVGIGTSSPSAKLQVNGDIVVQDGKVGIGTAEPSTRLQVQGRVGIAPDSSADSGLTFYSPDGAAWFHIDNGPTGGRPTGRLRISHGGMPGENEIMNLVQSGSIGIGTANPEATLHVNSGDDLPQVELTQTTEGKNARLRFQSFMADPDGKKYSQLWDIEAGSGSLDFSTSNWGKVMTLTNTGRLGIGTDGPETALHVNGTATVQVLQITGGGDLAEPFPTESGLEVEPGTVMVIDDRHPGKLKISESAHDRKVAGIVSGAGGINPGLTLAQDHSTAAKTLVAMTGRVFAKAEAISNPIEPGDLLTTSNTPGYAMKAADDKPLHGAILGKAMSPLREGLGLVLVLVNLH